MFRALLSGALSLLTSMEHFPVKFFIPFRKSVLPKMHYKLSKNLLIRFEVKCSFSFICITTSSKVPEKGATSMNMNFGFLEEKANACI